MEQVELGQIVSIDNFLDNSEWMQIKNLILYSPNFPVYFQGSVTGLEDHCFKDGFWNYAFIHSIYKDDQPISKEFKTIYDIFMPKFKIILGYQSLIRAKLNLFPYTEKLKEYDQHVDLEQQHFGAVFSLNTCDGFTRIGGKEKYDINDPKISSKTKKIDSVKNRMVFFNSANYHNSTSTTNSSARININFNFHY